MPPEPTAVAARSATLRSAVTNGKKVLAGVDGRSASARRYRDLIEAFERDLDLGGVDRLSMAERGLLRQAAILSLRAEQLQVAVVRGEAVDGDELIRLSSEARRVLAGLRKHAKPLAHVPLRERLAAEAAGAGEPE